MNHSRFCPKDSSQGPLPGWRTHDIRRSVATGMVEHCGVSIAAVERLLNHVSGTFCGIVGVYQRAELWHEQVAAVVAWGYIFERK